MPKYTSGITKVVRVRALLKVLERWGKLNKRQIDQHVAALLSCSVNDVAKSLYRDLDELVGSGEVSIFYFQKDGSPIENYDSAIHRTSIAEWALSTQRGVVLGEEGLRKLGGAFYATERVRKSFSFESAEKVFELEQSRKLFFRLNQVCFVLNFSLESAPVHIVVSRISEELICKSCFEEVIKVFGKRSAILFLPIAGLSGYRQGVRYGHFVIQSSDVASTSVKDLNSKNGTYVYPFDQKGVQNWVQTEKLYESSTVSAVLDPFEGLRSKASKLPFMKNVLISPPTLVMASNQFSVTVF